MNRIASTAVAAALVFVAGLAWAAAAKAELDGKTFDVTMAEKSNPDKSKKDTLIFENGAFRSMGCDQYGFTVAKYTTGRSGDATTFESTATSAKEGTMIWKGAVKASAIDGTALWQKKGQADIAYVFSGTLR